MLACEICSRTSDRDREIENLREDREAILTIDARESKEECCDALEVLAISTEQCPRLSIERRKHHAVRQRGGISFRFTSVTFSTARGSRSWSRVLFP